MQNSTEFNQPSDLMMNTGPAPLTDQADDESHRHKPSVVNSYSDNESKIDLGNTQLIHKIRKPSFGAKGLERMTLEDSQAMSGTTGGILSGIISPQVFFGGALNGDSEDQNYVYIDQLPPEQMRSMNEKKLPVSIEEQAADEGEDVSTHSDPPQEEEQVEQTEMERPYSDNDQGQRHMSDPSPHRSPTPQADTSNNSRSALQVINEPPTLNGSEPGFYFSHPSQEDRTLLAPSQPSLQNLAKQPSVPAIESAPFTQDEPAFSSNLEMYGWGQNDHSQLGNLANQRPTSTDRTSNDSFTLSGVLIPRPMNRLSSQLMGVRQIVCGKGHSLFLSGSRTVWGLGSNQAGQLGLSSSRFPTICEARQVPLAPSVPGTQVTITSIATGSSHSILAGVKTGQDGKATPVLFGCGLNDQEQLGKPSFAQTCEGFEELQITSKIPNFAKFTISKVFCTETGSGVVLENGAESQIWIWGQATSGSTYSNLRRIKLPTGDSGKVRSVQSGEKLLLILTSSNRVYLTDTLSEMKQILEVGPVKEIAASFGNFACLTFGNQILCWSQDEDKFSVLEHEANIQNNLEFRGLTCGKEFGHIIDQNGNLYGWGNNKHGELGTGDCFPRPKLAQVRIFTSDKHYLRCKVVYNGHSFALGLFDDLQGILASPIDSVSMRNQALSHLSDDNSLNQTHTNFRISRNEAHRMPAGDSYKMNSSRFGGAHSSQHDERQAQIQKTEKAIENYRKHSQDYKHNVVEYTAALGIETRMQPFNPTEQSYLKQREPRQSYRSGQPLEEVERRKPVARSISPYLRNKTLSTLNNAGDRSSHSPSNIEISKMSRYENNSDLQFRRRMVHAPEQLGGCDRRQMTLSNQEDSNKYSFSQLKYKFDENKAELQPFKLMGGEPRRRLPTEQALQAPDSLDRQLLKFENYIEKPAQPEASSNPAGPTGLVTNVNQVTQAEPPRAKKPSPLKPQIQPYIQEELISHRKQSPTVTSIETFCKPPIKKDQQRQRKQSKLASLIERSISATSTLLDQSKKQLKSRGPPTNLIAQSIPALPKKKDAKENPLGKENERINISHLHRPSTEGNSKVQLSEVISGRSKSPASPKSPNQQRTGQASLNEISLRTRSSLDPTSYQQLIQQALNNGTYGSSFLSQNLVPKQALRELNQKLNRYKRKIKKYLSINEDLKNHNDHLKKQNERLMAQEKKRSQNLDSFFQDELSKMEQQMTDMQNSYQSLLEQKEEQIAQLTQENLQMLDDIEDRDTKHEQLEKKFTALEEELNSLPRLLQDQSNENKRLKDELARQTLPSASHTQSPIMSSREQELLAENQRKTQELEEMKQEIEKLKTGAPSSKNPQWEAYQALLSGKTASDDVTNHSLSGQRPILLNWTNAGDQQNGNLRSSSDPSLQVKTDQSARQEYQQQLVGQAQEQEVAPSADPANPNNYLSFQPSLKQMNSMLQQSSRQRAHLPLAQGLPPQSKNSGHFYQYAGQTFNDQHQQNLPTFQNTGEAHILGHPAPSQGYESVKKMAIQESSREVHTSKQMLADLQEGGEPSLLSQMTHPTQQAFYQFGMDVPLKARHERMNHSMMTDFSFPAHSVQQQPTGSKSVRQIIDEDPHISDVVGQGIVDDEPDTAFKHQRTFDLANQARASSRLVRESDVSKGARSKSNEPIELRDTFSQQQMQSSLPQQDTLPAMYGYPIPNQYAAANAYCYGSPTHQGPPGKSPMMYDMPRPYPVPNINPMTIQYPAQPMSPQMGSIPTMSNMLTEPSQVLPEQILMSNRPMVPFNHLQQFYSQVHHRNSQQASQQNAKVGLTPLSIGDGNSSLFNSQVPMPPQYEQNPKAAHHEQNFNFSELSGDEQSKILRFMRDRSDSREKAFLSRNARQAIQIQNEAEKVRQMASQTSAALKQTLSPKPLMPSKSGEIVSTQPAISSEKKPKNPQLHKQDPKMQYKSALLGKFEKKTTEKLVHEIERQEAREALAKRSRHQSQENLEAQSKRSSIDRKNNCKMLNFHPSPLKAPSVSQKSNYSNLPFAKRDPPAQRKISPHGSLNESLSQLAEKYSEHAAKVTAVTPSADPSQSQISAPIVPENYGQLRSIDRLTQIQENRQQERKELATFKERSKDWMKRRDRPGIEKPTITHSEITKKYNDAFRNLSQEVRKKIEGDFNKRYEGSNSGLELSSYLK